MPAQLSLGTPLPISTTGVIEILHSLMAVALVSIAVIFVVAASTNVWWAMHAWREPAVHEQISMPTHQSDPNLTFSAIVPFRNERESVVRATVHRLQDQTHDWLEIVLSVGHDDQESIRIGQRLAAENPDWVILSVDKNPDKNKPKQLNTALGICCGDYVAIFDAESLTSPGLISHAAGVLRETGCEVLQCGVQLINHRTTWFSLRNCLEYYFWFRSRLHLHAQHGFIPLGGNTVFMSRRLLLEVGGWDDRMLTEDCDLGVRLSSRGVRVAVSYDAALVTREETPDTLGALIKQRSRWNQGFLQVLLKGEWRALATRRQRALALYTLIQPYIQALTFTALPLAVAGALLLKLPLALAMLMFVPLVPTLVNLAFEAAALRAFGHELGLKVGLRDHAVLILSLVPYQAVLGYAALRALVRHWRGRNGWEKTPHSGNHLVPTIGPAARPVAQPTAGAA